MLLFEDGTYAYIHAGQSVEHDSVVYVLQPATKETVHAVDRCHRKAMKAKDIDCFGVSVPVRAVDGMQGEVSERLFVLDFEGETVATMAAAAGEKAGNDARKEAAPSTTSDETWEIVDLSQKGSVSFEAVEEKEEAT